MAVENGVDEEAKIEGHSLTEHASERMSERGVSKDDVRDALKNSLKKNAVKYDKYGRPS